MKRAVIYSRVSTIDQNPQSQLLDLEQLASQRGFEVIDTYVDHGYSGVRVKRPSLDRLMTDARRGRFDVLLVWSCNRVARSTRHLLEVLDELNQLNIQFFSFREALDTSGPLGRAITLNEAGDLEASRASLQRILRQARLVAAGSGLGSHPI